MKSNPIEQKPDLDVLQLGFDAVKPNGGAFPRRQGASHERSMVSSSGVCTGLAM